MFRISSNGTVRFSLRPSAAAKCVWVVGSFNGWRPQLMMARDDGSFWIRLDMAQGVYEYKFIVDGSWCVDPDHSLLVPNPYGSENSVALIIQREDDAHQKVALWSQ